MKSPRNPSPPGSEESQQTVSFKSSATHARSLSPTPRLQSTMLSWPASMTTISSNSARLKPSSTMPRTSNSWLSSATAMRVRRGNHSGRHQVKTRGTPVLSRTPRGTPDPVPPHVDTVQDQLTRGPIVKPEPLSALPTGPRVASVASRTTPPKPHQGAG